MAVTADRNDGRGAASSHAHTPATTGQRTLTLNSLIMVAACYLLPAATGPACSGKGSRAGVGRRAAAGGRSSVAAELQAAWRRHVRPATATCKTAASTGGAVGHPGGRWARGQPQSRRDFDDGAQRLQSHRPSP